MAHFARIDENGEVQQVIVIDNEFAPDPSPEASEPIGQAFIASIGLDGEWKQTSYNGAFRGKYAGVGMRYYRDQDVFARPQPFPSWSLNRNGDWEAPVPLPDGNPDRWKWDEDSQSWLGVEG